MENTSVSKLRTNCLYKVKKADSEHLDTFRLVGIKSGNLDGTDECKWMLTFESLDTDKKIIVQIPLDIDATLEDNGIFPIEVKGMEEKIICVLNSGKIIYAKTVEPTIDPMCFYFFYCNPDGTVNDAHSNDVTYKDMFQLVHDKITFFLSNYDSLPKDKVNDKGFANLILDIIQVHEKYSQIREFVENNYVKDAHIGVFLK